MVDPAQIRIPAQLLPADGRFGSGPSKVRSEAVGALAAAAPTLLGTSHRKAPVKAQVRRVREGLATYFSLPDDWEVWMGNGGTHAVWDALAVGVVRQRSAHSVFGEFSAKFAAVTTGAPFLADPVIAQAEPGSLPVLAPADVDVYALTHNETSTGVTQPVARVDDGDALVLVDATSAAGALAWDVADCDVYYFSPQKVFASEGGIWFALVSPAAIERLGELSATGRWVPPSLDLTIARDNSAADQTYNTPSISTFFLMGEQLDWLAARGGLKAAVADCEAKSGHLYAWAEAREWASPFVADPALRSPVVATIDLDDTVAADDVTAALRANGVLDTDAYRKLGRNQLRIAVFPAVDHADVEALTATIDHIVEALTA